MLDVTVVSVLLVGPYLALRLSGKQERCIHTSQVIKAEVKEHVANRTLIKQK
jgi:hypothetical protein